MSSTTKDTPPLQLQRSEIDLFEQLTSYPFTTDREFATGLSIILGHPETPASEDEISRNDDDLVLQAKCYYFSRKEKLASPLRVATYKSWLQSRTTPASFVNPMMTSGTEAQQPSTLETPVPSASAQAGHPSTNPKEEPNYPTSFAHIVELITTGQPIPGIQDIPDTILEGQDTPSTKPRRRKPWEKEDSPEAA